MYTLYNILLYKHIKCIHCLSQNTGYTALMLACKGDHQDTVATLVKHKANIHLRNNVSIKIIS